MTKTKTIIISILLIASAILIKVLSRSLANSELVGFLAGIVCGAGLVILVDAFFKKKADNNQ
jgi:hypothetical protein